MKRAVIKIVSIVLTVSTILFSATSRAEGVSDQALHKQVNESLVKLSATGIASIGDKINDPQTVFGTGFFVGEDGYILTTAHFFNPLKDVLAVDTKIKAKVFGFENDVDVLFISEVSSLDLVLLRAFAPRGKKLPASLEIGSSKDINLDNPRLLTSGWDGSNYLKNRFGHNSEATQLVPYAWTVSPEQGDIQAGLSGSPVYMDRDGKPLVVGVVKATARENPSLALMIPIENSFQLIGQFKMQELQREVVILRKIIGYLENIPDQPLTDRVIDIEDTIKQIENSFSWNAELNDEDGSIIIAYEKLVSGDTYIDEIEAKMKPYYYTKDDFDENAKTVTTTTTLRIGKAKRQNNLISTEDKRIGRFVIKNMRRKLSELLENNPDSVKGPKPFREIEVSFRADILGSEEIEKRVKIIKSVKIVPNTDWIY